MEKSANANETMTKETAASVLVSHRNGWMAFEKAELEAARKIARSCGWQWMQNKAGVWFLLITCEGCGKLIDPEESLSGLCYDCDQEKKERDEEQAEHEAAGWALDAAELDRYFRHGRNF